MKIEVCAVFLLICATFAQDISNNEGNLQEEGRELRDYNQDWRAVDTSGWIPQSQSEDQPLKRRRIRKRKRRPPVIIEEELEEPITRKRTSLDQIKEPWEEISDELNQKSNSRRRLTPIYDATEEITEQKVQIFERVRDPFTALQEAEEKQKKKVETPDLKTLLKQSGGLSLSEVLQQKNLTLSELLKGNQQAISVLAEAETSTSTEPTSNYRRLPPSVALRKDPKNERTGDSTMTSHEVMEAQRKRLALLHGHKSSKLFPDVIKVDVVTEETTEKRIFVPSNPSTEPSTTTMKSKTRKLPMTSAKMNKLAPQETVSMIPDKAVSMDVNEIFGFNEKNDTEMSDEPFKMIIDLGEMTTQTPQSVQTTPSVTLDELTITTTSVREKLKHVTAKEEIMEILKNPNEREHLSRILRTRNMTVEELVQLRERGSSQLHLADIFHNKTREPEPKDEPFIGHIQPDVFNDFSFFTRKPKTLPLGTNAVSSTQPSVKIEVETTTKLPYTITSFPTYKIETNKDVKVQPFLPIWQQLYPHFFADVYENNNQQTSSVQSFPSTTEKINYEELERLEEIENALSEAANGRLKVDTPQNVYEDDEEFINLPSGVRSAILASLAIIGLSLFVFLTILLIFKWSQKQKRLTYNGSFSGSKIRSPILEPEQRRTFRTFVSETLGKKRNYYKAHLQSMSDSIWDNDEKKSYMI